MFSSCSWLQCISSTFALFVPGCFETCCVDRCFCTLSIIKKSSRVLLAVFDKPACRLLRTCTQSTYTDPDKHTDDMDEADRKTPYPFSWQVNNTIF